MNDENRVTLVDYKYFKSSIKFITVAMIITSQRIKSQINSDYDNLVKRVHITITSNIYISH